MNYTTLYQKNADFLSARKRLLSATVLYNGIIPFLFMAAYPLLWVYGYFAKSFTPKDFAWIFFFPALTLLVVSVLRSAIARPRPYEAEGAGILPLKEKKSRGNSFPSRHLACAGVISVCFLPYLPAVGALLLLLSSGLAYTRFALGWHYPSDLIVGFLLGVAIGAGIFFV